MPLGLVSEAFLDGVTAVVFPLGLVAALVVLAAVISERREPVNIKLLVDADAPAMIGSCGAMLLVLLDTDRVVGFVVGATHKIFSSGRCRANRRSSQALDRNSGQPHKDELAVRAVGNSTGLAALDARCDVRAAPACPSAGPADVSSVSLQVASFALPWYRLTCSRLPSVQRKAAPSTTARVRGVPHRQAGTLLNP